MLLNAYLSLSLYYKGFAQMWNGSESKKHKLQDTIALHGKNRTVDYYVQTVLPRNMGIS